jgi:hypothetical protein
MEQPNDRACWCTECKGIDKGLCRSTRWRHQKRNGELNPEERVRIIEKRRRRDEQTNARLMAMAEVMRREATIDLTLDDEDEEVEEEVRLTNPDNLGNTSTLL